MTINDNESASISITNCSISAGRVIIPIRLYRPLNSTPSASLLWVHGGSFISGDLDMPESDWVARKLCEKEIVVATVDYRHAGPLTRFPAASNDVLASWQWFNDFVSNSFSNECTQLIGGASAGGNLVSGVIQRLGIEQRPLGVILAYPVVHAELPALSDEIQLKVENLNPDFRFLPEKVVSMSLDYVGDTNLFSDPIAFPANSDLNSFPQTLIVNSEHDDLRSSGEAFGKLLKIAGVQTQVSYEIGSVHGHLNQPDTEQALNSIELMYQWIKSLEKEKTR